MKNLFSLFRPTWRTVLSMLTRLFQKGQVKEPTQCLADAINNLEKDETEAKGTFVDVESTEITKKSWNSDDHSRVFTVVV